MTYRTMCLQTHSTNTHLSRKLVLFEIDLVRRSFYVFLADCIQAYDCFFQAKYGFVAFSDPEDFLKAWKEMDGSRSLIFSTFYN